MSSPVASNNLSGSDIPHSETGKVAPENRPDADTSQSWGDRFKKKVFNKGTYTGINYVLNAFISTVITYAVETKWGDAINRACEKLGKYQTNAFGVSRTILITSGGNLLVLAIKGLEDRRQKLQFGIGHMLDSLQEATGHGNAASRQNLADYAKIKQLIKGDRPEDISGEDKARWSHKYRLTVDANGKSEFQEHVLPWHKAIISRAGAFLSALVLNSVLIGSSKRNSNKWLNYNHYVDGISPTVSKNILQNIPGLTLSDPNKLAEIMFNEAISTASAAIPHRLIQNALHKDLPEKDMPAIESGAKNSGEDASAHPDILPTQRSLQPVIAASEKDFRARETEKGEKKIYSTIC